MKLAVVPLPNEVKCEVVPRNGQQPPPIFFVGRFIQFAVVIGLFLCAVALVVTTYFAASWKGPNTVTQFLLGSPQSTSIVSSNKYRALARHFDGSRPLRTGDLVMLDGAAGPKVRQIAATPNQGVLLRRGGALHALYVAGDDSYVVISDKDCRIVRSDEIRATVPFALATAAR